MTAPGRAPVPPPVRQPRQRTTYRQTGMRTWEGLSKLGHRSLAAQDILGWLCTQGGSSGGVQVSQGEIARRLGMARETASRALKILEDEGYVASAATPGMRTKLYFVDPELCWGGTPTRSAMSISGFYEARIAAGNRGVPAWREDGSPWRLTLRERQSITRIPDQLHGDGYDVAEEVENE